MKPHLVAILGFAALALAGPLGRLAAPPEIPDPAPLHRATLADGLADLQAQLQDERQSLGALRQLIPDRPPADMRRDH